LPPVASFIQVPYNASFDALPAGFTAAAWLKVDPAALAPDQVYTMLDKSHGDCGWYDDHSGWAIQVHALEITSPFGVPKRKLVHFGHYVPSEVLKHPVFPRPA
jgi:hypothetical protein